MTFEFRNLDEKTREIMLEEFNNDFNANNWYKSSRLSPVGVQEYPNLVKEAFLRGTIESLEESIKPGIHLNTTETIHMKNGTVYQKSVPKDAPRVMANEFNRYYVIAICKRAIAENKTVCYYRGRESSRHREESNELIGAYITDLEAHIGYLKDIQNVDNHIPKPNSGITVELV